jgi:hypothetical protein
MPDQQTLEMLAKTNADIGALSIVISELMAEQCRRHFLGLILGRKSAAKLAAIAANINKFLDELPFTPAWQMEQMKAWTRDRVEVVISGAQRSLSDR